MNSASSLAPSGPNSRVLLEKPLARKAKWKNDLRVAPI